MLHYRQLFLTLKIPCMVLKPMGGDFLVVDVNEEYLKETHQRREQFQEKMASEAFQIQPEQEKGMAVLAQSLYKVMATGEEDVNLRVRFDFPDPVTGRLAERHWKIDHLPVLNDQREVEYIMHTVQNVTDQEMVQVSEQSALVELEREKQQYLHFVKENTDGLYSMDLEGNFLSANEGLARLAGLPLEEVLKMNFLPLCHPEDRERIRTHFKMAVNGVQNNFEARFLGMTGNEMILEINLIPTIVEGNIVGVYGISKDRTQMRQTEQVVIEKSRFLEANASFISHLLEDDLDNEVLEKAFGIIGQTVSVDRMYYFGAHTNAVSREVYISQKVEWTSEYASPQINNPEMQNMPAYKVFQIMGPLTQNKPYEARLSELEESAFKDIFVDQDIKAMLILPIFLNSELYGFIGFDDCRRERQWSEEEIRFLQSLSHYLTTALERRSAKESLKKKEEALKLSEQKFKALVQEGSDILGILDEQGNYTFVSDSSIPILGISPDEFLGHNAFDFIHPEDVQKVQEQFTAISFQKQLSIPPFRFKNAKGEWRWIECRATNMISDPHVQGIVTNSRDITTLVEQADEIKALNERYLLAATATQDLIYDWDLLTDEITRFHRSITNLFGYPVEELDDRDFWNHSIHPDDLAAEDRLLEELLPDRNASYMKSEYRFRRADGSYAKVVDKAYIIRDAKGKAIRIVGAISDMSKLLEQKEALKSTNKRYKMAMKATNEVIWDWDLVNNTSERSKVFADAYGYRSSKTSNPEFWFDKICEKDRERVVNSIQAAIRNKKQRMWQEEYNFEKADGGLLHLIDRGYISRDKEGNAVRMVGAVLDVTESRRTIARIQRQNEVLREIAWEQSHLVRAPLVRLQGLLDLMETEMPEDYTNSKVWEYVKDSTEELDQVIREIVRKSEMVS